MSSKAKEDKVVKFIGCSVKQLPMETRLEAANTAITENPVNRPRVGFAASVVEGVVADVEFEKDELVAPQFLAVLTTKYWGTGGVRLTVSFMDNPKQELIDKIILHMNAWGKFCNVSFTWTKNDGDVRISRGPGGYYSYLGTDIKHVPPNQQTMNLEGFTVNTPESEYKRVVRHETGHTLGFPHEHMRAAIIAKLDRTKTVDYFNRTQGWSAQTTIEQVLTPVSESSIMGTPDADEESIMCYQLPGSITKTGKPIVGGSDINANDQQFAAKIYPLAVQPPVTSDGTLIVDIGGKKVTVPAGWSVSQVS